MYSVIKPEKRLILSSMLALCATLFFVFSDATIKYLAMREIKFYHFLFYGTPAYLLIPFYLFISGQLVEKLICSNYFVPLIRGLVFLPTPFIVFLSLQFVSLPEFTTLTMTAPLFALIFSIVILRERINVFLILSLLFGILGVIIVIKPGFHSFNPFFLLVLLNALLISIASLIVNKFNNVTSAEGYFIYGGLFVHSFSIGLFFIDPKFFDFFTSALIILASIFVNCAMFFLVIAFKMAQKSYASLSCLNYLQILWSVLVGSIIFNQVLSLSGVIGACFIVVSGLFSLMSQTKQIEMVDN